MTIGLLGGAPLARHTVVRWAGGALLLNGVLDFIGVALRGNFITPSSRDAETFAQWASGGTIVPAYLIVIVGTAIGTFGYVALWPAIGTRLAMWGALLAALGYQFLLALFGILISFHAFATAGPQVGTAAAAIDFGGSAGGALQGLSALNFVGSILLALAIWRSGLSPKWAGVPLAIAPFLLAFPISLISELIGCVLLALAGALIVWGSAASESAGAAQMAPAS
jgi:hypothetical protein